MQACVGDWADEKQGRMTVANEQLESPRLLLVAHKPRRRRDGFPQPTMPCFRFVHQQPIPEGTNREICPLSRDLGRLGAEG